MNKTPVRHFTILDAIVLVAATAAGFAWTRDALEGLLYQLISPREGLLARRISWAVHDAQFFLAAWSLAVLALRLRRPRPRLRHLASQPGSVVCIVAVLGMVSGALRLLAKTAAIRLLTGKNIWTQAVGFEDVLSTTAPERAAHLIEEYCVCVAGRIAFPIISAWLLLAWGRRCRPEPNWVDRAGRILGVLWIAAALYDWYMDSVMFDVTFSTPPPPVPPDPPLPPLPPLSP